MKQIFQHELPPIMLKHQTSNKHSNFLFKTEDLVMHVQKFFCKIFKMVYHFYSQERISAGHA